jgi:hypothetical protein
MCGPDVLELALDLDGRYATRGISDSVEALTVGDQHSWFRIFDAVENFVAYPPAVHAYGDGAEADGGPEGDDPFGAVRGQNRDTVARFDAVSLAQHARGRSHTPKRFGEGKTGLFTDEVRLLAVHGCVGQKLPKRLRTVLEDGHLLAKDRAFDDLERGARPRQLRFYLRQCLQLLRTDSYLTIRQKPYAPFWTMRQNGRVRRGPVDRALSVGPCNGSRLVGLGGARRGFSRCGR